MINSIRTARQGHAKVSRPSSLVVKGWLDSSNSASASLSYQGCTFHAAFVSKITAGQLKHGVVCPVTMNCAFGYGVWENGETARLF